MKYCSRCNTNKDIVDFGPNKSRKDGLQSACRECMIEYRKQHYYNNKEPYLNRTKQNKINTISWFKEYKNTLSCEECDENHPATLDFHHVDSEDKEHNIGVIVYSGYPIDYIKQEIDKCIVLCANCHRKHHYNERNMLTGDEI